MRTLQINTPKLQDLADQAFHELGHGPGLLSYLKRQIANDSQLLLQAIDVAVRTCVRTSRLSLRANIKEAIEHEGQKFLFSDWPLMNGETVLAKATREQLLQDADRYHTLAEGNARSERFLRLVAQRLEDQQKVHEIYAEPDLAELWGRTDGRLI